ncbi:MAG: ArgE/DapE family deacylase [Candidatus Limnocylindrales bacterium]
MTDRVLDAARAAADAVDPADLRAELAAIIRIPSITGREEAVAASLTDRLRAAGMAVEATFADPAAIRADPAWPGEESERSTLPLIIGRMGSPGGRRVILSGHIDVVPPGDPATWTADPWGGEVREGALYGRGACDMKGGVAAILGAVRALVASGAAGRLAGELLVALVPGEEDGGQGTLAAIRAGATGDLAIITEPSNLDIVVAHAGAITFRLTVPGRAAHASQRREGVSALDNLYVVLRALEADETARNAAETDPLMTALGLPYPTIVGIVAGGEWASTVLDRVVVDGRYGVKLGQSPAEAGRDLRRAIDDANESDPFLRAHPASVEIVGGQFGSGRVASDHPLPVGLAAAAESITGRRPALLGEPYGADMRLFINEGGTPCVMFGPGDVKVAHSADEHVPLAEVEACARVLAAWVVRELGVA